MENIQDVPQSTPSPKLVVIEMALLEAVVEVLSQLPFRQVEGLMSAIKSNVAIHNRP